MRPGVDQERRMALGQRHRSWHVAGIDARWDIARSFSSTGWKQSGRWARIAFFGLAVVAVAALFAFLDLIDVPAHGWIVAAGACGLAELLIRRFRFFWSGIEEGLWLAGLFAIVFGLPGPSRDEGLLLLALGAFVAGLRMLQPLFVALGTLLVLIYAAIEWDANVSGWTALILAVVLAVIEGRVWRRPSSSQAAVANLAISIGFATFVSVLQDDISLGIASAVIIAMMAVRGLQKRLRGLLVAVVLGTGILIGKIVVELPREDLTLLVTGSVLLGFALWAERRLRSPWRRITSHKLLEDPDSGLVEVAATIAITPTPAQPEGPETGGDFGGGGASAGY